MFNSALQKKSRDLDDLDDILIVRKITAKEPDNLSIEDDYGEEIFDLDKEQHLLEEEREILFKKQVQLFQADERGKQALLSEINAIKQRQEKRDQVFRYRQHALDIEKERAKKIAMLPPPLPASVKLLLRKNDNEPEPKKPEILMPDELQVFHMSGAECHQENKENILSPEELEARQKMHEEWQKRAKKRFNEAIKKDRQKEEYLKVMKEIQNAELLNRREIAKSIISENKSIPCPLSDKFQMVQNQADIEAASEKIFKKMGKKEHVIEDIEGYEDSYEEVFGKIDSGFESKMIDCVPSFVKENYEYLLEDDSKFQGGKNFSGLDDSSDVMNEAYIESPDYERLSEREKLDEAISHLDKLRTDIQTEYDQTLRPLLEAAISEKQDAPKKDMSDKAVEAKILEKPAEDKAVGTEMPHAISVDSPPLTISNFLNSGVMAFKRRFEWPRLGPYSNIFVPPMHQRNVHYSVRSSPEPGQLTPTSWSTSSYCSLPLQHGIPATSTSSGSLKCDICTAEREKELARITRIQTPSNEATPLDKVNSDSSKSPQERRKLSEYVQLLATKYLAPKPATKSQSDSALSLQSMAQSVSAAFEREVVPKFREVSVTRRKSDEHPLKVFDKPDTATVTDDEILTSKSTKMSTEKDIDLNEIVEEINVERKKSDIAESLNEVPEYDEQTTVRGVQQILGRIPYFTLDFSTLGEKTGDRPQQAVPSLSGLCPVSARPHIFHELSTIHEMDSALTAESLHASKSKLSNVSAVSNENEMVADGNLVSSKDRIKMASLLDPPDPDVTDLAKSIHFVGETQKEIVHPVRQRLVSSETQDSASASLKKDSSMPSSFLSVPSVSNDSVRSANRPFSKDSRIVPHFTDGSQKDSKSEITGISSLTPGLISSNLSSPLSLTGLSAPSMKTTGNIGSLTPGLFSSNLSSPFSLTGLSTPSVKSTGNTGSLESGYTNSPIFTKYQSSLFAADGKFDASTSSSSPALSSVRFTPTTIDSRSNRNEDRLSLLKSDSSSSLGKSDDSKKSQSMAPHFDLSGPSSVRGGGTGMQPMTRQSDISGPSVKSEGAEFQPMTTQFDFPGLSGASASGEFHPMTPHFNIFGPTAGSDGAEFLSSFDRQGTVHSKHFVRHWKETVSSSSSESFAPMTPHSSISIPSDIIKPDFGSRSNSAENLRALTSASTISTPSLHGLEGGVRPKNPSSGSSNVFPMKLRIGISSDSSSSKSSSSNSINNLPQLNYRFTVKAPVSDDIRHIESIAKSEQNKVQGAPKIHLTDSLDKWHFSEKASSKPETKLSAKACSSGYFTPQIGLTESPERKQKHQEINLRRDIDEECSKADFIPASKQNPFTSAAASGTDFQKQSSHSKNLWGKAEARAFNKPYGHLQLTSSASSSSENLSEISGSKVLHQSTPVKSAEQIAQEPGILEEPDLTLMTTEYSLMVKTTLKPADDDAANEKKESAWECKTPTNQSVHLTGSAATPSMLSFLQHEISCEETKDDTKDETIKSTPVMSENRTDTKERQATQFPTSKYKERTKRLWNNLEEVKKKKELVEKDRRRKHAEEQRRKIMAQNRSKAKEYAKKSTPK